MRSTPTNSHPRGSKWAIGNPIGWLDIEGEIASNRISDWTVQLVTDPIDQSKIQFKAILSGHRVIQSHRLAASIAQSSIWDSLWSDRIRRLGLQSPSLSSCSISIHSFPWYFNYVTPLWSAANYYQQLSVRWKAWNIPKCMHLTGTKCRSQHYW